MTYQEQREAIAKVALKYGAHEAAALALNLPAESIKTMRDILNRTTKATT